MEEPNLYEAPAASISELETDLSYGGLNRIYFVLCLVGGVIALVLFGFVVAQFNISGFSLFLPIFTFAGLIVAMGFRFKNQGASPWLSLLVLVPLANAYVFGRCLVCPEGFADSGRLDTPGRVMMWVYIALLLLNIGLSLVELGD